MTNRTITLPKRALRIRPAVVAVAVLTAIVLGAIGVAGVQTAQAGTTFRPGQSWDSEYAGAVAFPSVGIQGSWTACLQTNVTLRNDGNGFMAASDSHIKVAGKSCDINLGEKSFPAGHITIQQNMYQLGNTSHGVDWILQNTGPRLANTSQASALGTSWEPLSAPGYWMLCAQTMLYTGQYPTGWYAGRWVCVSQQIGWDAPVIA